MVNRFRYATIHFPLSIFIKSPYSKLVELKLCPRCKKPYLASHEFCPHCPEPYTWDQESYMNLGCLLLMVLPVFLMILFWIALIFAPFFR